MTEEKKENFDYHWVLTYENGTVVDQIEELSIVNKEDRVEPNFSFSKHGTPVKIGLVCSKTGKLICDTQIPEGATPVYTRDVVKAGLIGISTDTGVVNIGWKVFDFRAYLKFFPLSGLISMKYETIK